MQGNQGEIVILKPTNVFLSFLAAQLPHIKLPELNFLQTDSTAYVIAKQESNEATLNEIERQFPIMFRYEIQRWLGENARNKIEGTFLDFLCCFKFDLHSQIVLMEPSILTGQQLLRIKPRPTLLKWMRQAVDEQSELMSLVERVKLSHLAENSTVVIKSVTNLTDIKPFLKHNYRTIFEAEMMRMCDAPEEWPKVESYQDFNHYFTVNIHSQLVNLLTVDIPIMIE